MTDWKVVHGSQEIEPLEIDTTLSVDTVYQRRNIKRVEVTYPDSEEKMSLWEYEEREMTLGEYAQMKIAQEETGVILAFKKQEVIDEYTVELMEGGII